MSALAAFVFAAQVAQALPRANQPEVSSPSQQSGFDAPSPSASERSPPRFFVSSPYLSFTNWLGEDIGMYELHAGYRASSRDKIGIKAATWKLNKPLGIPLWDPSLLDESEFYGGRVREYGIGPIYQRMLWKGLFASAEAMLMRKTFLDESGQAIAHGVRLYTSVHLGYYVSFFSDRLFIEPQVHCNYWPVDSKGPAEFRARDARWNNYFLFEPNLYLGVNL